LGLGSEKNGVGWVSVLPDGIAAVDVTVNGERVVFDGYGGHDKVPSLSLFRFYASFYVGKKTNEDIALVLSPLHLRNKIPHPRPRPSRPVLPPLALLHPLYLLHTRL
jgi:hypothetical protein